MVVEPRKRKINDTQNQVEKVSKEEGLLNRGRLRELRIYALDLPSWKSLVTLSRMIWQCIINNIVNKIGSSNGKAGIKAINPMIEVRMLLVDFVIKSSRSMGQQLEVYTG